MHRVSFGMCFIAIIFMTGYVSASGSQYLNDEQLYYDVPNSWILGFEERQAKVGMTVFIPEGATAKNWTENITTQIFFGGLGISPKDFSIRMRQLRKESCPSAENHPSLRGEKNGYKFEFWQETCDQYPKTNETEAALFKAIEGKDSFYLIQKVWKRLPTDEEVIKWSEYLKHVYVCDPRIPDRKCPPKVNTISASDYYAYSILDENKNERILLNIPKTSVEKYPGWRYNRNGPASIEIWYPSLHEKVSYNAWISSAAEKKAAEAKPNSIDRKLSISIGLGLMAPPEKTLDTSSLPRACGLERGAKYTEDGTRASFRRYIQKPRGSGSLNIIYHPVTPIKGLYCIKCIENANCRLFGITDSRIPYEVFYEEERMPEDASDIHIAVGKYLDSKSVELK